MMTYEFVEDFYMSLPKNQQRPFFGIPAANVAAWKYILNNYGDNEHIANHLATHKKTGYLEYDNQYTKILTLYLQYQ